MVDLPDLVQSGEVARLIPVIADSRREQRVASVFLATLSAVPQFAQALFGSIDQRLGKRSVINTFTEVVLKEQAKPSKDRPDGLIQISAGKKSWAALVEVKIGSANLDPEQIERYLQLAKDHQLDAVVTISNQFVARAGHSPIDIPKMLTRKVCLYHWSWSYILTEAVLLQTQEAIGDPDQAFILREFVRFLSHDSVGVSGFDRMPTEWTGVATQVKSGAVLRRSGPEVEAVVLAWHQETRDLALRLSRHLAVDVTLRLSRTQRSSAETRFKEDCQTLASDCELRAEFEIPNAASVLSVFVGLKTQTIRIGMTLDAPIDRQRATARLNWLLRQLKDSPREEIFVKLIRPSRSAARVYQLGDLLDEPKAAVEGKGPAPKAFEIFYVSDDARRFRGRNTFIQEIERAVPFFYDKVGQYLKKWTASPPKPVEPDQSPAMLEPTTPEREIPAENLAAAPLPGNDHASLMEIPSFLRRFGI